VRALVIGGFAALPVLWLLPEWWGSGDLLRAAHRAQNPRGNSPAFAENPIRAVLDQFGTMLTSVVWAGVAALVLVMLLRRGPGRREITIVGALVAGAVLWVAEVALMTSDGFSGNIRYLVMPAAIVCLAAGVGVGWLVRAVLGHRVLSPRAALALVAAVGIVFAAPARRTAPADAEAVTYQARLNDRVAGLVARAGGPERLKACGDVYTGPFQVPVVAWSLHLHTGDVSSLLPIRPAVVFRVRPNPTSGVVPTLRTVGDPVDQQTLAAAPGWRVVAVCKAGA
jgi:hypothetical protein